MCNIRLADGRTRSVDCPAEMMQNADPPCQTAIALCTQARGKVSPEIIHEAALVAALAVRAQSDDRGA
jgi:hypothetical protein